MEKSNQKKLSASVLWADDPVSPTKRECPDAGTAQSASPGIACGISRVLENKHQAVSQQGYRLDA